MFSNLSQNSVLYIFDANSNPKITNATIERVSIPRPKYNTFNPNMEMIVDIVAIVNNERREFKGVPNAAVANFGEESFTLAENKDVLASYITSMLQNSKTIIESVPKHERLIDSYEEALQELNPSIKSDKEIQSLQAQVAALQNGMNKLLEKLENTNNERKLL